MNRDLTRMLSFACEGFLMWKVCSGFCYSQSCSHNVLHTSDMTIVQTVFLPCMQLASLQFLVSTQGTPHLTTESTDRAGARNIVLLNLHC